MFVYFYYDTIIMKINRLNACFYVLNTNKDTVPNYLETRKIILEQPNITQTFQTYSISTIEVFNKDLSTFILSNILFFFLINRDAITMMILLQLIRL